LWILERYQGIIYSICHHFTTKFVLIPSRSARSIVPINGFFTNLFTSKERCYIFLCNIFPYLVQGTPMHIWRAACYCKANIIFISLFYLPHSKLNESPSDRFLVPPLRWRHKATLTEIIASKYSPSKVFVFVSAQIMFQTFPKVRHNLKSV